MPDRAMIFISAGLRLPRLAMSEPRRYGSTFTWSSRTNPFATKSSG